MFEVQHKLLTKNFTNGLKNGKCEDWAYLEFKNAFNPPAEPLTAEVPRNESDSRDLSVNATPVKLEGKFDDAQS